MVSAHIKIKRTALPSSIILNMTTINNICVICVTFRSSLYKDNFYENNDVN